jgi:hypothetical protein
MLTNIIIISGKLSRNDEFRNFRATHENFSMKVLVRHNTCVYTIGFAFHKSFLRKMLSSYLSVKVVSSKISCYMVFYRFIDNFYYHQLSRPF